MQAKSDLTVTARLQWLTLPPSRVQRVSVRHSISHKSPAVSRLDVPGRLKASIRMVS